MYMCAIFRSMGHIEVIMDAATYMCAIIRSMGLIEAVVAATTCIYMLSSEA